MVENAEYVAVIHRLVATSKELADVMQDEITKTETREITLDLVTAQMISTQLRLTSNLISGFLEENSTMLDRIATLVDRLHKK